MPPQYFCLSDHTDCFTCPHLKIEVRNMNTIYLLSSYGELGLHQNSQWGYGVKRSCESCHWLYLHALINDTVRMFGWWGCRRADWRRQSVCVCVCVCVCGDWSGAWQHTMSTAVMSHTTTTYMETKIVQSLKYAQIYSLMLFDWMLGFLITGSVCYWTVRTCLLRSRNENVMVRQRWGNIDLRFQLFGIFTTDRCFWNNFYISPHSQKTEVQVCE